MRARTFAGRLVVPAAVILFAGLGLLSYFFVEGEASRTRILVEYEADRLASTLLDAYRAGDTVEPASVDARVRGFGIYRPSSRPALVWGSAPQELGPEEARRAFRYDSDTGTLTLVRPLGMEGGPPRGMMQGGVPGPGMLPGTGLGQRMMRGLLLMGPGRGGALYLSLDIASYYRTRAIYRVSTVAAPLLVAALAAAFFLLFWSNARYRRRAEERETMARLGESARTLAHEIRNPLGAIRIQTALLRKKLPGGAAPELAVIEEETERLNALSRRVSELLKDPRGTPERIDLPSFLDECVARSPFPVRLDTPVPPCSVTFDRELLRSVLDNLVRNAWESYEGEPAERPIDITAALDGARLALSVSDRGKGIAPGMEEKVFDPFYTDKIHGSGIGLSLCRRYVRAAGGELALLPRSGGGTEARIHMAAEARV